MSEQSAPPVASPPEHWDGASATASAASVGPNRSLSRASAREEDDFEILRELQPADISRLAVAVVSAQPFSLARLRHSHHKLAQLIAAGRPEIEISAITGYDPEWIQTIQGDPAMANLIAGYAEQAGVARVELSDKARVLGVNALEELGDRLESDPKEWTKGQLMDLAKLSAKIAHGGAGAKPGQFGVASGPGVNIEVKFVNAPQMSADLSGPIIDLEPRE